MWAFGEYGTKEQEAARFIRKGASIPSFMTSSFANFSTIVNLPAWLTELLASRFCGLRQVTKQQFYRAASIEGPLDREHTILGRLEQSYLCHMLFGKAEVATC